jgi:hypothetical protein
MVSSQICDVAFSTENPVASAACSNNGYCVRGEEDYSLSGCSCFSGYYGDDCSYEHEDRLVGCIDLGNEEDVLTYFTQPTSQGNEDTYANTYASVPTSQGNEDTYANTYASLPESGGEEVNYKRQAATTSLFATTIGGDVQANGDIHISLQVPIEKTIRDANDGNYATWTTLRFLNQDQCDYPEGPMSNWEKDFEAGCFETFHHKSVIQDLFSCMGVESVCCFDDNDHEIDCNPDACDNPPCYRCYNGQMLASRGYIKTSKSGELTATGIAENCHNFKICLPWIQEVENIIQIIKIPEFDMVLTRVSFECFDLDINGCLDNPDKAWAIVIKSTARYPWFVREVASESGRLSLGSKHFDLINIENDESCGQVGEHCVQTYYYQIPGCNSLEDVNTYEIEGLMFDCYGDCSDALGEVQQFLPIDARITIQATQDNCGFDFTIDATDALSLDMDSYLDDYVTANAVFVQGDYDVGHAYLKIVIDSSIPVDHVNLLKVSSVVHHSDYS